MLLACSSGPSTLHPSQLYPRHPRQPQPQCQSSVVFFKTLASGSSQDLLGGDSDVTSLRQKNTEKRLTGTPAAVPIVLGEFCCCSLGIFQWFFRDVPGVLWESSSVFEGMVIFFGECIIIQMSLIQCFIIQVYYHPDISHPDATSIASSRCVSSMFPIQMCLLHVSAPHVLSKASSAAPRPSISAGM